MTEQPGDARSGLGTDDGTTPALPTAESCYPSDFVGMLYAAAGLTRPAVLEVDSPEAVVQIAAILEGHRPLICLLLGLTLGQSVLSLAAVTAMLASDGADLVSLPASDSFFLACLMLFSALALLQTPFVGGRVHRWLRWAVPLLIALTAAAMATSVDGRIAASVATVVGLAATCTHAGILLVIPPVGRVRLCRRYLGLARALGWRGVLFGVKPATAALSGALGHGLALMRAHPLRGRLARDGQPRLRRHEECARRLKAEQRRIDLPDRGVRGLGCGLPDGLSLWTAAHASAAMLGRYLDLPQDARGLAPWESDFSTDNRADTEALAAARALEDKADVIWLLRGVAVVLAAPL